MTIQQDTITLAQDVQLIHSWATGGSSTQVQMGSELVRSPAKLIADKSAEITANIGSISTAVTNAQTSATSAASSATSANTSATNAATSATSASTSATNASTSATSASTSATSATTSKNAAATSATAAATSATSAATSATNAATSATNSANSATASATSATAAANSAAAATASWVAATTALETLPPVAAAILSSTTFVDAIVYDTRTDSDGGAWRKRCQGTSWYNEARSLGKYLGVFATDVAACASTGAAVGDVFYHSGINQFREISILATSTCYTTYRAGSQEFPAVALIVAESTRIVIWDVTKSTPSMWAVTTYAAWGWIPGSITSIGAKDGHIAVGTSASGLAVWNMHTGSAVNRSYNSVCQTWSLRNSNFSQYPSGLPNIINTIVNAVAITTLPDAPIDPTTGVRTPTIYAFCTGGVSRIAHDGTVSSTASVTTCNWGAIDGDYVFTGQSNSIFPVSYLTSSTLPAGGASSIDAYWNRVTHLAWTSTNIANPFGTTGSAVANRKAGNAFGTPLGMYRVIFNPANRGASLACAITNTYNTGWMVGDIRRCWLSDSTTETITTSELVTGDSANFTGGTVGSWVATNGTIAVAAGEMTLISTGTAANTSLAIPTTIGKTYRVSATIRRGAAPVVRLGAQNTAAYNGTLLTYVDVLSTTNITSVIQFTATAATSYIVMFDPGNVLTGTVGVIDNISAQLAEADRSIKAQPLQIVGTITKTSTAGGRTSYSGFSATNYLQEASHADWNALGTGDFSIIMSGVKWGTAGTARTLISWGNASAGHIELGISNTNILSFYIHNGATFIQICVSTAIFTDAAEHTVEVKRSGTAVSIVVDGVVVASGASALTISNATGVLLIGCNVGGASPLTGGQVACVRISATATTDEQSKFIAAQENALNGGVPCVIDGTSSIVTAVGYDEKTEVVYAGTAWGTSAFSGLRRVSSSATTVGSLVAISAYDSQVLTIGSTGSHYSAPEKSMRAELIRASEQLAIASKKPVTLDFNINQGMKFNSATGWTLGTGWAIANGVATKTAGTASQLYRTSDVTLTLGKSYVITYTITAYTAGSVIAYCGSGAAGTPRTAAGTYTETLVATTSTIPYLLGDAAFAGSVDNFIVRESTNKLPVGFKPSKVFVSGVLQSEGTYKDYTVTNDGFVTGITFAVEPAAQVQVEGIFIKE